MTTDIFMETVIDCLKLLPFLFAAFLLIELLEHYTSENVNNVLVKFKKAGPLAGALLGCIPQCGFSVLAANLYAGGIISAGTIIAVFLATSDEAVIIILSDPQRIKDVGLLILVKLIIAVICGYFTDLVLERFIEVPKSKSELCSHCGCHEHNHGILMPAIRHTSQILIYLFVTMLILNVAVNYMGTETFSKLLLGNTIFQPFLAALIGFIPNCAASVLLTQLYLNGIISFPSVIAGLCTGAGAGILVFLRMNKHGKETAKIIGLLYVYAVIAGIILELVMA